MLFALPGQTPLVSVCIITYNHEKYIIAAVESVLMQETDFPCEFIIGEDCSTDNTRAILQDYAKRYPMRLLLPEKNLGAQKNWKTVMEAAQGKYIAYFEGDDAWVDPSKLQKQAAVLEANNGISFCYSNAKIVDTQNPASVVYYKEKSKPPAVVDGNYVIREFGAPTCTFFFRNFLNPIPEWVTEILGGDQVLMAMACKYGTAYYIDECLGQYNYHYTGLSTAVSHIKFLTNDFRPWLNMAAYFNYDKKIWESLVLKGYKDIDKVFHRGSVSEARRLFWQWPLRKVFLVRSMCIPVLKMAIKLHLPAVSRTRQKNKKRFAV